MARRQLGMGILRLLAVVGGVVILAFVVLTAGTAFLPGSKMGRLHGASAAALAGDPRELPPEAQAVPLQPLDAGTDAGTGALTGGPPR